MPESNGLCQRETCRHRDVRHRPECRDCEYPPCRGFLDGEEEDEEEEEEE